MNLGELLDMDLDKAKEFIKEFNKQFEPTEEEIRKSVINELELVLSEHYWKNKFTWSLRSAVEEQVKENAKHYIRDFKVDEIVKKLVHSKEFETKIRERASLEIKIMIGKIIKEILKQSK